MVPINNDVLDLQASRNIGISQVSRVVYGDKDIGMPTDSGGKVVMIMPSLVLVVKTEMMVNPLTKVA